MEGDHPSVRFPLFPFFLHILRISRQTTCRARIQPLGGCLAGFEWCRKAEKRATYGVVSVSESGCFGVDFGA